MKLSQIRMSICEGSSITSFFQTLWKRKYFRKKIMGTVGFYDLLVFLSPMPATFLGLILGSFLTLLSLSPPLSLTFLSSDFPFFPALSPYCPLYVFISSAPSFILHFTCNPYDLHYNLHSLSRKMILESSK